MPAGPAEPPAFVIIRAEMTLRLSVFLLALAASAKDPIFLIHQIGTDRSEGVAVFDVDRDGLVDVTSGAYWYKAPDWTRTEFREARPFGEFIANSGEHAIDVNGDGYPDIISGGWGEDGLYYFENPKKLGVMWTKVRIAETRNLEGTIAVDVDGDGGLDILPSHWGNVPLWWIKVKKGGFEIRPVGQIGSGHGVGFGDLDGDGKPDIITVRGWYRQVDATRDQWEFRPEFDIKESGIRICAYDLTGDGLMDLIYSRGHGYGLFWMEQKKDAAGKRTWIEHPIDLSASQLHTLEMVDLTGDGKPELLVGKRYRGHDEKDPGSFDPLNIDYYTIEPGKQPKLTRHPIAYNSLAGAGMQFRVADLDGDGDVDIVMGGKTGQFWFENLTVNKVPWQKRDVLFKRYPPRL